MIEEPGSLAGKINSPKPQRGPDPNHRLSLAIFMSAQASVFNAQLANTNASCAASAANLFGADTNGNPVNSAIFLAANSANRGWVFNPVPTAVPPIANSYNPGKVFLIFSMAASSCATYPENSCPNVKGTAS